MRCLVTGASGFLGSHLVRDLVAHGHAVTILLRPGSDQERIQDCISQVSVVRGSLQDLAELTNYLRSNPVEAAFHLAWSGVSNSARNKPEQITDNVTGSLALWDILRSTGCSTFIGAGSQAEYGPTSQVLRENLPTFPVTGYGSSKLALCILLRQLCAYFGMRFVWLRLLSAYGPADEERRMVPSLIGSLLRNERPPLTRGEQIWDFLYVSDAAAAFRAAMEGGAEGIFNVGSGSAVMLRDFISKIRDSIDPSLPLGFGELPYRPDQVMHLEADISRLRAATDWQPTVSISDGIKRTVQWHRNRPSGSTAKENAILSDDVK